MPFPYTMFITRSKRALRVQESRGDSGAQMIRSQKRYLFSKRIFDISLSFVLIITVLSWLIPLLSIMILFTTGGPIFFRQKRTGLGGKAFTCYKLCTMHPNGDAHTKQATAGDIRITWIGGWLRRTNLDELPQLINILFGHMSFVGPRPHMISDCNRFSSLIPGYKFRNLVKPGLTGMAQAKGYHGPAFCFEDIFRRYQWDAYYVRNAGLLLDFRILFQTIRRNLLML